MSKYQSFRQLALKEVEGVDYSVRTRSGGSGIAVMAIHGGGIEPGTTEIAEAIAGRYHSFYTFSGLKDKGNGILHINSSRFDEPRGLEIAKTAWTIVSLHGCSDPGSMILLGQKNSPLKSAIQKSLEKAGFRTRESLRFPGMNPFNICNRCRSGEGVQLEICSGLRRNMFENLDRFHRKPTAMFAQFVDAIKSTLEDIPPFMIDEVLEIS